MRVGWISPSSRLMLGSLDHLSMEKSVFDILLWGVGGPQFAGLLARAGGFKQSVSGKTWRYMWSEYRPGIWVL